MSEYAAGLPQWVPAEVHHYLEHIEQGCTIRELARRGGYAPSTISRQVRKMEHKRDDPLIDEALVSLKNFSAPKSQKWNARDPFSSTAAKDDNAMSKQFSFDGQVGATPPTDVMIEREARRILRRLNEAGACLAVAKDMEKAVVVRELPDGRTTRTAVLDRAVAQALALKDWICAYEKGKITRYSITSAGRAALKKFVAADESLRAGFAEAPAGAMDQGAAWLVPSQASSADVRDVSSKRVRYNAAESPVMTLSRRRDKNGEMFLPPELVSSAERLREDFELAQMGENAPEDWHELLSRKIQATDDAEDTPNVSGFGADAAQNRVVEALTDLGPGLCEVALRCCCYLEGMELAEKRMGWSARSGKIVLRIALQRLNAYYAKSGYSNLIG